MINLSIYECMQIGSYSDMHFLCVQDMWFYLSENEKFTEFGNEELLIWHESNIPYAVWGPESTRTLSLKYYPSEVTVPEPSSSFLILIPRDLKICFLIILLLFFWTCLIYLCVWWCMLIATGDMSFESDYVTL